MSNPGETNLREYHQPAEHKTHLFMGMSLDGSMEGRRDAAPDPRRSEPRLSESRLLDIMG